MCTAINMAVELQYWTWTPALLPAEYLYRVMKFNNCSIPEEASKLSYYYSWTMNSSRNGMNVVWRIIVVEQQRSNDCFSLAQFALSLSLFTGDVHDSLPFVLPLALPWRLHESVRWQRPANAALGPGIQVSVFLSHKTLLTPQRSSSLLRPEATSSVLWTANSTFTPRPPSCLTSRSWSPTTSLSLTSTALEYWSGERDKTEMLCCQKSADSDYDHNYVTQTM